jgi:serine/threonine protein kinase
MPRTTVFVTYSHTDKMWLDRLRVQLKPLERDGRIDLWDDTKIKPGSSWRDDIREALQSARVAVLLVSADFLASEFIAENELPPLLKAAKEDGATILPVIVSPCLYTEIDQLKEFQAINDPTKPLVAMKKGSREQVFLSVARAVRELLGENQPEARRLREAQRHSPRSDDTTTERPAGRRPTPWRGTMREPDPDGLRVWGEIDEQGLRGIRTLELMKSTPHSILQKCTLNDDVFVLKGTREDLCDIDALRQLVTSGPRPLPFGSVAQRGLEAMATPRAIWMNDNHVWELQRYYDGRSLADVVGREQKALTGRALLAVVETIVNVLEVLYEKELVHRDINPGNVLDLGGSQLRVIDWSFCCRASSSPPSVTTPGYTAPEQEVEGARAECAADWYSLGATCFALANGFTPHERGAGAFHRGLQNIQLGTDFRGWRDEEFFGRLLSPDPSTRPKPWESKRELFDIRRDSKPGPRIP